MQAQTVWQVWRRIMREVPLQNALFNTRPHEGPAADVLASFGLNEEQQAAARAYASQADRAKWFVLNYRFRLSNSFLNALETGAPLVLRALLNKGANINQLGEEFLDTQEWKDFGPYVYSYCQAALDFLARHEVSAEPFGLRDLIGLEMTVVALMRDLADQPSLTTEEITVDTGPLQRTPYAKTFCSKSKLSHCLRDKKSLGRVSLEAETEHYLVFLPHVELSHKYSLLPLRAVEILAALEKPCPRQELPARLVSLGFAASSKDDEHCLIQLKAQRALCGEGC
ncbi:hypothetical protein [Azotobacter armeniacus]